LEKKAKFLFCRSFGRRHGKAEAHFFSTRRFVSTTKSLSAAGDFFERKRKILFDFDAIALFCLKFSRFVIRFCIIVSRKTPLFEGCVLTEGDFRHIV